MVSQKQAVTNAVLSLFPNYEMGGEVKLSEVLNKESKDKIKAIVFAGFQANEVVLSADATEKYSDNEKGLQKYSNGLVDNWIRKNPDFNSGEKYEIKNKGSRAGSGDETVRALRALKKTTTDSEVLAEIETALQARLAEIKPAAKAAVINVEALPEHLKHLVKSSPSSEEVSE